MAGSGKPVLLSAGSWGGRHHTWSAPPQAALRFPQDGWLWQALPGLRMQEVLGHGDLRLLMPDEICPGGSPGSHGVWSKRRQAALALTKWILAPKWHPLGSRRGCGWEGGGRAGPWGDTGLKAESVLLSFIPSSLPGSHLLLEVETHPHICGAKI